ncbi:ubiquitin carboxyl-terminal hydrolase 36-like isoform X2 [Acropora millepora]|uniref:ubiquitin carboxyl-terminal hydrolase 36-like isoform X2 n=1 Tax=Acropora millepora TaxID=45264 RepID=UPI001CF576AB|nr:ubiquitin carboxyl-terminal hydrolase 36-like isoform X2 [Acropora millepora]
MNEQAPLSNSSDEEVTLPRCSKDHKRPSRISSDDDQELEHAGPPMDNVDNTSEEEVTVKRWWKGHGKCLSRVSSDDDDQELELADPLKDKVDSGWDQENQSSPSEEALTRCSKDSSRKRTVRISSDDDDDEDLEDAAADNATPSLALRKRNERRKGSCEKFRRQLKLDKYKAKREESQAKKRLRLSGHESDINDQCHSSLHESMNEKDFPSAEPEDDPTFEESPILISSDSEDLSTPNSKDGSSQDSEEDPTLEGFIVPNSECSSQDVDWHARISAEDLQFLWNPTEKEVFQIFLQSLLIRLLLDEDPSYGCLERIMKENPQLVAAERKVEDALKSRKTLVSSSRWDPKFTVN